jgi:hypothetical protein
MLTRVHAVLSVCSQDHAESADCRESAAAAVHCFQPLSSTEEERMKDNPTPRARLQHAIKQLEWGADIRIQHPWQIENLKEIIAGEKREAPSQDHRPAK